MCTCGSGGSGASLLLRGDASMCSAKQRVCTYLCTDLRDTKSMNTKAINFNQCGVVVALHYMAFPDLRDRGMPNYGGLTSSRIVFPRSIGSALTLFKIGSYRNTSWKISA
jgi:hypothetical protein